MKRSDYVTFIAHLSLDVKFSVEIIDTHWDFTKFTIEIADSHIQAFPNLHKSFPLFESHNSLIFFQNTKKCLSVLTIIARPPPHPPEKKIVAVKVIMGTRLTYRYKTIIYNLGSQAK